MIIEKSFDRLKQIYSVEEFCGYEAVFAFEFCSDDIYELTGEEFSLIESRLEKYPFELKNWIDVNIKLYYNDSDNLLAVLYGNDNDYFQMFYGASSQQGYEKLLIQSVTSEMKCEKL